MRGLLVSDLHYTLKQLDWVDNAADRFDLVVIAGGLLLLHLAWGDTLGFVPNVMNKGLSVEAVAAYPFLLLRAVAGTHGVTGQFGSWEVIASTDLDVASDYYVSDDRLEIRGTRGIIWVNQCSGRMLEAPPLVLWVIVNELRQLARMLNLTRSGRAP